MSLFSWIGNLFKPAASIVDSLDLSGNKKQELENVLAEITSQVTKKMLELDMEKIKMQSDLAKAAAQVAAEESKSASAFVRLYKPMIITLMFILILLDSFLLLPRPLPEIFVQVFGAAFGVAAIAPSVTEKVLPVFKGKKRSR